MPLKSKHPTPQNHTIVDTWATHSGGHQVADNPYSNTTAWRDTRARKLGRQFQSGDCLPLPPGRDRDQNLYTDSGSGAAAGAFDGTLGPDSPDGSTHAYGQNPTRRGGEYRWVSDAEAKRSQMGLRDIRSFMGVNKRKADGDVKLDKDQVYWTEKKLKLVNPMDERGVVSLGDSSIPIPTSVSASESESAPRPKSKTARAETLPRPSHKTENEDEDKDKDKDEDESATTKTKTTILSGTSIYMNGSTLPQISDHKLKHLLVAHGAKVATYMARKGVSHIIVAAPGIKGSGAGGGLAARKLQKEISRGGWKGVKVVGVEW